jgi:predicted AAA+ superfamily ATPase
MDRALLIEIIQEQYRDLQNVAIGIKREKLNTLLSVMDLPHVIAITGMRRSGKSTLLLQLLKQTLLDKIYYLDFEDERLIDFQVGDFNLLHEVFIELFGERKIFVFDEVQIISEWEAYIRRQYKSGYKFIITGSSAELLSSELSTKLTGRHVAIELLPFSFREYLIFSDNKVNIEKPILTKERGLLKNAFNTYMQRGGIPEYLEYKNPIILKSIYENILYKDVIVRYDIKAVKAIRELSLWLLSHSGSLISYSKLKNILQLGSVNTVKNYIHYLENAYLIFTVEQFAYSMNQQTTSPKKIYCADTGLIEHIGFQFSKNTGRYLENIVYLELRRQEKDNIYYYKTNNNLEVDFCIRESRNVKMLIQVSESLNEVKTREREIRALTTAMDELNLKKGLIITLDTNETIQPDNKTIEVVSIISWLTKPGES